MSSNPFVEELVQLRAKLAELLGASVTYRSATVTAAPLGASTFEAELPDGQILSGLAANPQQLPQVGQTVRLRLEGSKPVYEPAGIAAEAVTSRELALGAVLPSNLAQSVLDQMNGALIYRQGTQPDPPPAGRQAYWWDTSNGNALKQYDAATGAWDAVAFGNGAIDPNSLIASDVLASGTVSAQLLESVLVLASVIVAGNPSATHAAMESTGFYVYDSNGNVVGQLGTVGNDFFSILDSAGQPIASIDQTGQINGTGLNVSGDPVFQGTALSATLAALKKAQALVYGNGSTASGRVGVGYPTEAGVYEFMVTLDQGKRYMFRTSHMMAVGSVDNQLATVAIRYTTVAGTGDPGTPSTSSTFLTRVQVPMVFGVGSPIAPMAFVFDTPAGTGKQTYRFLLTLAMVTGSGNAYIARSNADPIQAWVEDAGSQLAQNFVINTGTGGTLPPPTQNYYTGDIAPTGNWTFRGDNSLRTDTTEVVQGTDPSGYNGDGKGGWDFTIPNITGTVTRVDLYLYNDWAYYNSGGRAKISVVAAAETAAPTYLAQPQQWDPGVSYPKPGPVAVTLPSAWNSQFQGKTKIGIYLGPSGTTDETYYIKANGGAARLRIWYTQ